MGAPKTFRHPKGGALKKLGGELHKFVQNRTEQNRYVYLESYTSTSTISK